VLTFVVFNSWLLWLLWHWIYGGIISCYFLKYLNMSAYISRIVPMAYKIVLTECCFHLLQLAKCNCYQCFGQSLLFKHKPNHYSTINCFTPHSFDLGLYIGNKWQLNDNINVNQIPYKNVSKVNGQFYVFFVDSWQSQGCKIFIKGKPD